MKLKTHYQILKLYIKEAKNSNCREKIRRITIEIEHIKKIYEREVIR